MNSYILCVALACATGCDRGDHPPSDMQRFEAAKRCTDAGMRPIMEYYTVHCDALTGAREVER